MTHAVGFTVSQLATLGVFWVLVGWVPAYFAWRGSRADGNPAAPAWLWVVVLTGPVGFLAWYMDRRIRARRARAGRPMPE